MTIKEFFRNLFQTIKEAQSVSIVICTIIAAMIICFSIVTIVDIIAGGYGVIALAVSAVFGRLIYAGFRGK